MFTKAALLVAILFAATSSSAESICGYPELTRPLSKISEARPIIEWQRLDAVEYYQVQLESRVPEGKILVSLDTRTSEPWLLPPQALTDYRADVEVRVSAWCKSGDPANPGEQQAFRFDIDTGPTCVVEKDLSIEGSKEGLRFKWHPLSGAIRYDLSVFSGTDGRGIGSAKDASDRSRPTC